MTRTTTAPLTAAELLMLSQLLAALSRDTAVVAIGAALLALGVAPLVWLALTEGVVWLLAMALALLALAALCAERAVQRHRHMVRPLAAARADGHKRVSSGWLEAVTVDTAPAAWVTVRLLRYTLGGEALRLAVPMAVGAPASLLLHPLEAIEALPPQPVELHWLAAGDLGVLLAAHYPQAQAGLTVRQEAAGPVPRDRLRNHCASGLVAALALLGLGALWGASGPALAMLALAGAGVCTAALWAAWRRGRLGGWLLRLEGPVTEVLSMRARFGHTMPVSPHLWRVGGVLVCPMGRAPGVAPGERLRVQLRVGSADARVGEVVQLARQTPSCSS